MKDLFVPTDATLKHITIQDCIDMKEKKNYSVVVADGEVLGFESDKALNS